MGRRRRALPRLVPAAAARDGRGLRDDAADLGRRAPERLGRGARRSCRADRSRGGMTGSLARRLGTGDAVVIGLGSMVGAGIFSAFGPAADAAGSALLAGLALAGGIAYCNAVASAQLAAEYPTSGGTYVYGRQRLGEWWGFAAGWAFVVGKTASCAAMALTFAAYAISSSAWVQRLVAVAAVLALTALNYRGISRTAQATRLLVGVSLACLLVAIFAIATSGETDAGRLGHWPSFGAGGLHGVLQAAGFLFFAFAGYARIATMGEECATRRGRSRERSRSPSESRSPSTSSSPWRRSPAPGRPLSLPARSRSPLPWTPSGPGGLCPSSGSARRWRASARSSP